MTNTIEAPAIAGAVFAGPRRSAQTALVAAMAASVLLHLAVLAVRLSSGSGDATAPLVLRPLAVRLITASVAPTATIEEKSPAPGTVRLTATPEPRVAAATPTVSPATPSLPSAAAREAAPRQSQVQKVAPAPAAAEPSRPVEAPPAPLSSTPSTTSAYRAAAGLDPPPRPLDDIAPEFPDAAGTRGGTVVLRLLLSETGAIDKIEVVRSTPPGLFDAAALAAFGAARFSPGFLGGTPVRSQIMFEVEFAPQAREGGASSKTY